MFVDQALFYNDIPNGNECKQKTKRNSNKSNHVKSTQLKPSQFIWELGIKWHFHFCMNSLHLESPHIISHSGFAKLQCMWECVWVCVCLHIHVSYAKNHTLVMQLCGSINIIVTITIMPDDRHSVTTSTNTLGVYRKEEKLQ